MPPVLARVTGWAATFCSSSGCARVTLTTDKVRELVARHWSARTEESLPALGLDGFVPFAVGGRGHLGVVPRPRLGPSRLKRVLRSARGTCLDLTAG